MQLSPKSLIKFDVPSIGSTTQVYSPLTFSASPSSPTKTLPGNNCSNSFSKNFCTELDISIPPQMALENALTQPVYQMIAFLPPEREHILSQENPQLKFTRWNPTFLDIIPPTGGKDVGIQSVMEHYGLSPEEVMAFGDGENDLPMLRYAGIGVAMGSASDFVKSQADYVTGTVDELGILHALKHYGLM